MPELENSLPEQSEDISSSGGESVSTDESGTIVKSPFFTKLKTKWQVILGVFGTLAIFGILLYVAYSYSRREQEIQPTPTMFPLLSPILTATPLITPALTPRAITPTQAVSPKGKIAFVRDGDIWTINPDGSGEEKITDLGNNEIENLAWSPSGNRIALALKYSKGKQDQYGGRLFILDVSSKKLTPLTQFDGRSTYTNPIWSPKGDKIAVQLTSNASVSTYILNTSGNLLFKADAASIDPTDKFNQKRAIYPVGWFSDNESLLVKTKIFSSGQNELLKLQPNRAYKQMSTGKISSVDLSPDGTKIAYTKDDANGKSYSIHIFDTNNKAQKTIGALLEGGAWTADPKWSPDGSHIAYKKLGTIIKSYIVSDVDGKNPKDLMDYFQNSQSFLDIKPVYAVAGAPYSIYNLIWGPNSQRVVVATSKNKNYQENPTTPHEFWLIDFQKNQKTQLTTNASQPAWSPQ